MQKEKNEKGLASIVIVSILVILLSLITLSFSKIMNRAVNNSLNNQLSAAANYAAQSGINDAMAYIKGQASPDDVSSSDCTSLLKEPGMNNLVDLSGDGNTKITCLLVNPRPTDLMYQQLAPNGSQVIKATTSDAVDKVMFSWQASNGTNTNLPSSPSFTDVPTWNNAGNVPVLRVSLYPVPPSGKISGIQANSKTFFLAPTNAGGAQVTTIHYSGSSPAADGSVEQVACNAKNTGINNFTADYTCNAVIDGLYDNIAPDSYYYLTLTPIYNQADVKIKAVNSLSQPVQFIDVQTVIDATAKANDAKKRLQERVDSNVNGDNLAASDSAAPGYAIRSEKAVCKQLEFHKSYYNYILNNAPSTCNSGASGIPTVPPTLTLSITGNDGDDSGVTRDSGDATPGGSGFSGVVYVNSSGTIHWKSTDAAIYCNASNNASGRDGDATDTNGRVWSGDKNPISHWDGVTGTGDAQFNGVSQYTTYSMQCKGPYPSPTTTKTVTIWPRPEVHFNNTSVTASQDYHLSWTVEDSTSCTASGYAGATGRWSGSQSSSKVQQTFSRDMDTWPWNDTASHTYTITCSDPSGRTAVAAITLGKGKSPTCGGGSTCSGGVNAPPCDTLVTPYGDNTSYGGFSRLYASCGSAVDADGGTHAHLASTTSLGSGYVSPPAPYINIWYTSTPGTYCAQIAVWVDGWTSEAAPSKITPNVCVTVKFIIKITFFDAQGPYNNPNVDQRFCPDGDHHWMDCVRWATQSSDSSQVSCQVVFHGRGNSNSNWLPANWGWSVGSQQRSDMEGATFDITCRGPGGAQATDSRGLCYLTSDYAAGCSDANR